MSSGAVAGEVRCCVFLGDCPFSAQGDGRCNARRRVPKALAAT